MDLKAYYAKMRKIEMGLEEEFPIIESLETPDGAKAGVRSEVTRAIAARMVADGRARLASKEEAQQYRTENAEAKRVADQMAAAARMQVTVLSDQDLRALRGDRSSRQ